MRGGQYRNAVASGRHCGLGQVRKTSRRALDSHQLPIRGATTRRYRVTVLTSFLIIPFWLRYVSRLQAQNLCFSRVVFEAEHSQYSMDRVDNIWMGRVAWAL